MSATHSAAGAVPATIRQLLARARAKLGGGEAGLDSEVLMAAVLAKPRSYLYAHADFVPGPDEQRRYLELVTRRAAGEPVAYLTGQREFWSLELEITPDTLVPRPETERLVELALERIQDRAATALDLGTGSGAVALALAVERPGWRILGVDLDPASVDLAARNAGRLGLNNVRFMPSDWYEAIGDERFSLIVANPPYVREDDPCLAAPGLRCEPRRALASGRDGLDALRRVVAGAPRHLAQGAWLMCEHGADQGVAVRELFVRAGLVAVETARDLAGAERVTLGRRCAAIGERVDG